MALSWNGIESDCTATERMGGDSRGAVMAEFGEVWKSNGLA